MQMGAILSRLVCHVGDVTSRLSQRVSDQVHIECAENGRDRHGADGCVAGDRGTYGGAGVCMIADPGIALMRETWAVVTDWFEQRWTLMIECAVPRFEIEFPDQKGCGWDIHGQKSPSAIGCWQPNSLWHLVPFEHFKRFANRDRLQISMISGRSLYGLAGWAIPQKEGDGPAHIRPVKGISNSSLEL